MRPRRSLLWVPGDQPRKLERAAACGADVVVLDLEDGVGPDRKSAGRAGVTKALAELDFGGSERVVRVNADDQLAHDIEAAAAADGVFLPKVDGPADLAAFRDTARRVLGRVPPVLALCAETPAGVLSTAALMAAAADVVAWMWGSEDLAAATGSRPRGAGEAFTGPLEFARASTVLLAAATGTQAIDTVYPFYRDTDGLRAEAAAAAAAGFAGKGLIHPAQIPVVHEAFTPDDETLARARAVVEAFSDGGTGVTGLDGQMIDLPHLRAARITLSRAGIAAPGSRP